ncbi:hypothetical protein [Planotetraspora sp. GP83]|uniref:hypothetical protein n=1 Tax=Planotetraspora sp. GP83 TaxID=3156264 RepID=UPI003510FD98
MDIRPPWWGLAGMTTVVLTSLPAQLTTPPGGPATAPPTTAESPGPAAMAAAPAATTAATPAATPATVAGSLAGAVGAQVHAATGSAAYGSTATGSAATGSAADVRLTQPDAMRLLQAAGLGWRSSGHCTDPQRRECTSLNSIRYGTLTQTIELKRASRCVITVTGGTEVGHSSGYYSHENGFKVDIDHNKCIDAYITGTFRFWKTRGDGAALYCPWLFPGLPPPPDTDIYADEPSHWDILYR